MPTAEQIKQFLAGVVIPVLAGAAATWLFVHVHFLALFHIEVSSIANLISQLGVYAVTLAVTWLTQHNILKGLYAPAAKAGAGR